MRYRSVDVRIWGDEKFRSLTPLLPSAQGLFLYLLTNPNTTNIPGLYRAGPAAIAEELGWLIEDFQAAFDELIYQGLLLANLSSRVIFIPNAIKYNKPQSPNVIKSWASSWDEIPECELKSIAYHRIKAFVEGMGEAFSQAFIEGIGKHYDKTSYYPLQKIMLNQEQEQEQEQEQNPNSIVVNFCPPINKCSNLAEHSLILEIFEHWRTTMNHPRAKIDPKREKKIQSALKLGYSIEQLKQAIDGCANTPFNMGKNENKQRYDGIELIFRDAEHIERFIQNAPNNSAQNTSLTVSQIDQISEGAL